MIGILVALSVVGTFGVASVAYRHDPSRRRREGDCGDSDWVGWGDSDGESGGGCDGGGGDGGGDGGCD